MKQSTLRYLLTILVIVLMIAADQALKLYVHSHMVIGEARPITSWFWLCYVENNGMAFGIEWFSKLLLTIFRIVAVFALGWYMHRMIRNEQYTVRLGYLMMVALITAGALGNIIDCLFYGIWFDYAPLFHGRVIDMLYFPLLRSANGDVLFFRPVFNIADSCITCAVFAIILFFRQDLNESLSRK